MATLRLFASAREAAGTGRDTFEAATVGDLIAAATAKYGDRFAAVLPTCKIWLNGDDAALEAPLGDRDEVAVLPPVSGG
jgi:molybdopterin converting factor small subunit